MLNDLGHRWINISDLWPLMNQVTEVTFHLQCLQFLSSSWAAAALKIGSPGPTGSGWGLLCHHSKDRHRCGVSHKHVPLKLDLIDWIVTLNLVRSTLLMWLGPSSTRPSSAAPWSPSVSTVERYCCWYKLVCFHATSYNARDFILRQLLMCFVMRKVFFFISFPFLPALYTTLLPSSPSQDCTRAHSPSSGQVTERGKSKTLLFRLKFLYQIVFVLRTAREWPPFVLSGNW